MIPLTSLSWFPGRGKVVINYKEPTGCQWRTQRHFWFPVRAPHLRCRCLLPMFVGILVQNVFYDWYTKNTSGINRNHEKFQWITKNHHTSLINHDIHHHESRYLSSIFRSFLTEIALKCPGSTPPNLDFGVHCEWRPPPLLRRWCSAARCDS